MKNELIDMFEEFAGCYTFLNDTWRARACKKVATILAGIPTDITKESDIKGIKGIGAGSAGKIKEFLETGKCEKLIELRKRCPPRSIDEFMRIPGVGPKTAQSLWKTHKVATLRELKELVDDGTIKDSKLKEGIDFALNATERRPIGMVLPVVVPFLEAIRGTEGVVQAEFAGSLRRRKDTIRDVDFLVGVESITAEIQGRIRKVFAGAVIDAEGDRKIRARLDGVQIDVLFVPIEQYGAALQYFTGSKEHNVELRKLAKAKGWLLNEKGLFDAETGAVIAQKTEQEICAALGVPFLPPELRQTGEEIGRSCPPDLITIDKITGLLHGHTTASDGSDTLEEAIEHAIANKHRYIGITDHTKSLVIANGLNEEQWLQQDQQIEEARKKYGDQIVILHSAEMDVLSDGSCDLSDQIIGKMDFVLLALHRQPTNNVATRFTKAIEHIREIGYTKRIILAHPSGRQFGKSPVADTDWNALFEVCAKHDVVLEIDSLPQRLDLEYTLCRLAKSKGCKFSISTDTHALDHTDCLELGINVARRAWLVVDDIINTRQEFA